MWVTGIELKSTRQAWWPVLYPASHLAGSLISSELVFTIFFPNFPQHSYRHCLPRRIIWKFPMLLNSSCFVSKPTFIFSTLEILSLALIHTPLMWLWAEVDREGLNTLGSLKMHGEVYLPSNASQRLTFATVYAGISALLTLGWPLLAQAFGVFAEAGVTSSCFAEFTLAQLNQILCWLV